MKSFQSSARIEASADAVWALLTDAAGYPGWNPSVERVEGRIAPGERITVHVPGGGRAFPVRVTTFTPPAQMVWRGGMPLGLFKGVRTFTVGDEDGGAVRFTMREVYSGPLAPLIGRSIPDLQPSFDGFAAALKRAAEATSTPAT